MLEKLDMYITEMNSADLKKLANGKNISKIVSAYTNADDKGKEAIMASVDAKTKKQLDKMIEGGLI